MGRWGGCAALLAAGSALGAGCLGTDSVVDVARRRGALYYPVLSWAYDPDCVSPSLDDERRVADGVSLWATYWGVAVELVSELSREPGVPAVALCLLDEWPESNHSGLSDGPDIETMEARVRVWNGVGNRRYMTGLIAHEFGHIILDAREGQLAEHLPPDVEGVMHPSIDCRGEADECLWSPGDIEHLEAYGMVYQDDSI
jgi:hypothetical protein